MEDFDSRMERFVKAKGLDAMKHMLVFQAPFVVLHAHQQFFFPAALG